MRINSVGLYFINNCDITIYNTDFWEVDNKYIFKTKASQRETKKERYL